MQGERPFFSRNLCITTSSTRLSLSSKEVGSTSFPPLSPPPILSGSGKTFAVAKRNIAHAHTQIGESFLKVALSSPDASEIGPRLEFYVRQGFFSHQPPPPHPTPPTPLDLWQLSYARSPVSASSPLSLLSPDGRIFLEAAGIINHGKEEGRKCGKKCRLSRPGLAPSARSTNNNLRRRREDGGAWWRRRRRRRRRRRPLGTSFVSLLSSAATN